MLKNQCPVCNYHKLFSIRHLKGERTGKLFRLWFCRNCHSLFNPSGYREDDEQLCLDVDWHSNNYDDSVKKAELLIYNLLSEHDKAKSLIDIGCGIGSVVTTAKSFNLKAVGVEPNRFAVDHAKKKFGIELVCDYFKNGICKQKFDLVTCISVLEHLEKPRILLKDAINTLNPGGLLFVSVPFRGRNVLKVLMYILFPNLKGTPFSLNDEHIVHFSHKSIQMLAKEFGATSCKHVTWGWNGYLMRFD